MGFAVTHPPLERTLFHLTTMLTIPTQDATTDEVRRRLEEQVRNSPNFPPVSPRASRAASSTTATTSAVAAAAPPLFGETTPTTVAKAASSASAAVPGSSPSRSTRKATGRRGGGRRSSRTTSAWGRYSGPSVKEELALAAGAPKADRGAGDGLKTFLRVCDVSVMSTFSTS